MKPHLAAVVAAVAVVATPAFAADPGTGFYVGAGGGVTHFDQDFGRAVGDAYAGSPFTVSSAGMTDNSGATWLVYAGWQFHPNFAIEAGYADLGKARAAYTLERQGTFARDAQYKASAVTLAGVASAQFAGGFGALAKVGAAWTKLEYRETGDDRGTPYAFSAPDANQTRLVTGLGASYAPMPNLAIRLEWDRYYDVGNTFSLTPEGNGRFSSIDAIWIGAQYRF